MRQHRSTLLLFVLLTALSLCSLFIGVIDLRAGSILAGDFSQLEVLFISRLPRLLAILCTGVGMSTAGLIMQQLCQNKFVSPTTGATISSAQLGILIALVFMPRSTLWGRAFFSAVHGASCRGQRPPACGTHCRPPKRPTPPAIRRPGKSPMHH